MARPHLIGIAGASCSGKTTLARRLIDALSPDATCIGLDSYYYDLSGLAQDAIDGHNLDEPAALESSLLIAHIAALAAGRSIDKPVYDHKTHARSATPQRIVPGRFIIIEGLFTLYWPELRDNLHTRVFIDASHELCLDRRITRDRNQRGRTAAEVTRRYRRTVGPMFDRHVLPTRRFAHVIVDGSRPVEQSTPLVLEHIRHEQDGT